MPTAKHSTALLIALISMLTVLWACPAEELFSGSQDPADRMMVTIRHLSSEQLKGRGVDSDGLDSAAVYLEREMLSAGLEPAGSDGYFQSFSVAVDVRPREDSQMRISDGGQATWRKPGQGWAPEGVSADGRLEDLAILFWPDGLPAAPSPHGHTVAGERAVLILEREDESGTHIPPWQLNPWGFLSEQARGAEASGASALLVAADPWGTSDEGEVNPPEPMQGYAEESIPVVRLSSSWTRELLESAGVESASVSERAGSVLEGLKLDLHLEMERSSRSLRNVVGKVSGNGEWILISAHYDGLGQKPRQDEVAYHPGADDNASGVAVLLELARRFEERSIGERSSEERSSEERPSADRRGLVLVCFAGEEIGLAGSRHMAEHPPVPLEEIATVVNVDMVGRLREGTLICFGTGSGDNLADIVQGARTRVDPDLPVAVNTDASTPSDQAPFYAKGVPVLHWMTPPHQDYHRVTDTWDKIDRAGLVRVADLMESLIDTLQTVERPQFKSVASRMGGARGGRGYGAWLGTVPDFTEERDDGVMISGTSAGSPAEAAGLQDGDLLVGLAGKPIGNLRDFVEILRAHKPGDEVEVVYVRDGEERRIRVTLGKRE